MTALDRAAPPAASPFLTAEHEAFRSVVRRFVAKEIEPFAAQWDEAGEFPRELYRKAAAIGLLGMGFPEEYGGIPCDRFMAMMLITPKAITVNADSPYKTLDDLLNAAKANPGKIIHGGGDLGSTSSMVSKIIEDYFKIDVTYTPFEDQGVVQLLGGHIDYIFAQPTTLTGNIGVLMPQYNVSELFETWGIKETTVESSAARVLRAPDRQSAGVICRESIRLALLT